MVEANNSSHNSPENDQLRSALRRVADDIKELIEITGKEGHGDWQQVFDQAAREVVESDWDIESKSESEIYKHLIVEIYDHLRTLILTLKSTHTKLRHMATRDLLTGLYNRNYFNETIVEDIEKANRNHEILSFILLDIDKFKHINDTYGHVYGDKILKECAVILKKSVRKSDFLCRYAGDEFIIVTPMASEKDNEPLFMRLKKNLDTWNESSNPKGLTLSLSLGCSIWKEGRDLLEVLHEADKRMYKDKASKK